MLLICIALSCLFRNLDAQLQRPLENLQYDTGSVFFPGSWQENTQLLQVQPIRPQSSATVEVEKSNEVAYSTTIDQSTNRYNIQPVPLNQPFRQQAVLPSKVDYDLPDGPYVPEFKDRSQPTNIDFNSLLYSVTNFGINLLKNVNQAGNVLVSPFSVTTLLALLQQGALGETQEQLNAALRMTPNASATAYAAVTSDIKSRDQRNILKTANNIYVANSFTLNPNFKRVAQRNFASEVTPVSFGQPNIVASDINSWVASKTNNKIENLISPDSLSQSTQVVLVNAIYFKGLWEMPFKNESTKPGDFYLSNRQTTKTLFMHMRNELSYGMDPATNARVVTLPFQHNQYSLMIIVPSQLLGMTETLASLSDARLLSYQSFEPVTVNLQLPKFTIKSDIDLNPVLKNMGITNIFSSNAELAGLGYYQSQSPQISSAVHSAVLSIDENGGSAAAATAFAAVALSYENPPTRFIVDRPFIAVLWDNKSSLPLFIAKVENPQV